MPACRARLSWTVPAGAAERLKLFPAGLVVEAELALLDREEQLPDGEVKRKIELYSWPDWRLLAHIGRLSNDALQASMADSDWLLYSIIEAWVSRTVPTAGVPLPQLVAAGRRYPDGVHHAAIRRSAAVLGPPPGTRAPRPARLPSCRSPPARMRRCGQQSRALRVQDCSHQ